MVHLVPVAVVVLGVEAGDAQRGGVGDRPARAPRASAPAAIGVVDARRRRAAGSSARSDQASGDADVVVEASAAAPAARRPGRSAVARARASPARSCGWRHAPLLLAAARRRPSGRPASGAPRPAVVPAEVVEHLERLVGEVDRVAAVDEDVVGDRREHHVGDGGRRRRVGDGRGQGPLGGVGRAGLDEAPVPRGEPLGRARCCAERQQREPRWAAARVARHERQPVHERERPVGRRRGAASTLAIAVSTVSPAPQPACPVAGAEVDAGAHDVARPARRRRAARARPWRSPA